MQNQKPALQVSNSSNRELCSISSIAHLLRRCSTRYNNIRNLIWSPHPPMNILPVLHKEATISNHKMKQNQKLHHDFPTTFLYPYVRLQTKKHQADAKWAIPPTESSAPQPPLPISSKEAPQSYNKIRNLISTPHPPLNILQELHKGRNNLQLLNNPKPKISTLILSLPSYSPLCIIAKALNLSKRLSSIINKACVSPDEVRLSDTLFHFTSLLSLIQLNWRKIIPLKMHCFS